MIFGLAAPAIDILVERAGVGFAQIGDDETGVGSFRADFDAGDDPLDAAPAFRAVEARADQRSGAISSPRASHHRSGTSMTPRSIARRRPSKTRITSRSSSII